MREYGRWSTTMLAGMRRDTFKVEAFVYWLRDRGIRVDRTLVSHWRAGRTHLPADVLPLLAGFSGRSDHVFGPYLRAVGCEVVHTPDGDPSDENLVDRVLVATAQLGRLSADLAEARSPGSPGGVEITSEERQRLRTRVDHLMHLLAGVRRGLRSP